MMNNFVNHRNREGVDDEEHLWRLPIGIPVSSAWNRRPNLQPDPSAATHVVSPQQSGTLQTSNIHNGAEPAARAENFSSPPASDDSMVRALGNYLESKNRDGAKPAQQGDCDPKQWVADLEASLGLHSDNAETKYLSGMTDQLCQDRENVHVSSPFKLSSSTYSSLESSLFEAMQAGDGETKKCRSHPFCLSCFKHMDGTSFEFNVSSANNIYTPSGYEDLQEQEEPETGVEESPIYLMEIQDALSDKDGSGNSSAVLEDFSVLGEPSVDTTTELPLSVKFLSSSRLIEVLGSHLGSYEASRDSLIMEESLSLPFDLGSAHRSGRSALVAIVTRNSYYNQFHNPFVTQLRRVVLRGALVLKCRRQTVQLASHPPDPFMSQVSFSQFYMGRKFCFKDPNYQDEQLLSSKEFLRLALLNSDRFVPQEKRLQWDSVPSVLIMIRPHQQLPIELARFLLRPDMRRSRYDLALANAILYEPMSSNNTYIIPRYMPPGWWATVTNAHKLLVANTCQIQSESMHFIKYGTAKRHYRNGCRGGLDYETNAYLLERFCNAISPENDQAQKVYSGPQMRNGVCGYIQRTLVALEIERLRSHEDMKKHDMYSIRWERIEIPFPRSPHPSCGRCGVRNSVFMCAYHSACQHLEINGLQVSPGSSVIINSIVLLEMLPRFLSLLRPDDRLVTRVVVPGVADNFPLVSAGDLVRFRFTELDLSSEVVGEVADVDIKSEKLLIFLPPPFQGHAPLECFPYLQALLCSGNRFVDARSIIERDPRVPVIPRYKSQEISDNHRQHLGRFDMRFGFLGGRGFEISRQVLLSSVPPKKRKRKPDSAFIHLRRVLAPSHFDAELKPENLYSMGSLGFEWVTPVNSEQKAAVTDIVCCSHGIAPYIIYGPPGTGKTMTVVESVVQVLRTNARAKILVCAPSDAASDVLATRILPVLSADKTKKCPLLRINWWSRKTASLPPSLLPCSPMSRSGTFYIPSRDDIVSAQVVITKCFVAGCLEISGGSGWMKDHFTHLFIDETSQAMECEALVPMLKVGPSCSIILAGDPRQLSPTVRDPVAAKMGMGISIQERLMKLPIYRRQQNNPVMTKLVGNYRSHDALLTIPSNLFYGGSLECLAPKEVASPYSDFGGLGPARFPMLLCNVAGREQNKLDTPSFFNLDECKAVVLIIQGLLRSKKIEEAGGISTGAICVITPFRAQVLMLRANLRLAGLGSVSVGIVEDFQGQEKSIVLISTVLTQPHERWSRDTAGNGEETKLGFMNNPKTFNVAITRAHALCIIVGHANYLKDSGTYWTALVEHIQRNDGLIGADGEKTDSFDAKDNGEASDTTDPYSVRKLVERVEELKLLGAGYEDDKLDLSYYYEDTPQWKVMLA